MITAGIMIGARPELRQRQEQHDNREHQGARKRSDHQPYSSYEHLDDSSNHDAHRHTPNGACRKQHGPVAVGPRQASGKLPDAPPSRLTICVEYRAHNDRQQELQDHGSGATQLSGKPRDERFRVRQRLRSDRTRAFGGKLFPTGHDFVAYQRNAGQPRGRSWYPQCVQGAHPLNDLVGVPKKRYHGEAQRDQENKQKRERHHRGCHPAFSP